MIELDLIYHSVVSCYTKNIFSCSPCLLGVFLVLQDRCHSPVFLFICGLLFGHLDDCRLGLLSFLLLIPFRLLFPPDFVDALELSLEEVVHVSLVFSVNLVGHELEIFLLVFFDAIRNSLCKNSFHLLRCKFSKVDDWEIWQFLFEHVIQVLGGHQDDSQLRNLLLTPEIEVSENISILLALHLVVDLVSLVNDEYCFSVSLVLDLLPRHKVSVVTVMRGSQFFNFPP